MSVPVAEPAISRSEILDAEIVSARAHFARGDHVAALAQACAALKKDARSFEAHLLLGELALPRAGGVNPSLTIAANALRTGHHLAEGL